MKRKPINLFLIVLATVTLVSTTTACNPAGIGWRYKASYGVIIEPSAGRGSLGIYRVPRSALYKVYKAAGIKAVQDSIWNVGKPPVVSMCVKICADSNFINSKMHGWIYGATEDLRSALLDAQRNGNCLVITIISGGLYKMNWTNKSTGCYDGSLT